MHSLPKHFLFPPHSCSRVGFYGGSTDPQLSFSPARRQGVSAHLGREFKIAEKSSGAQEATAQSVNRERGNGKEQEQAAGGTWGSPSAGAAGLDCTRQEVTLHLQKSCCSHTGLSTLLSASPLTNPDPWLNLQSFPLNPFTV